MDTGEEDGLPFICRPHLPGVVNHALSVAAGAAPVDLWGAGGEQSPVTASGQPAVSQRPVLPQAPSAQSPPRPPGPRTDAPLG